MSRTESLLSQNRNFFFALLAAVDLAICGYGLAFLHLEARLGGWMMIGVIVVFAPIIVALELKGFFRAARLLVLFQGLVSIVAASVGVPVTLNAELYYIASMTLPLLVFAPTDYKYIRFSIGASFATWAVSRWLPIPELSSYWMPQDFPVEPFRTLNFMGTAAAITVFLYLHVRMSARYQRALDSVNLRLNEAQRIAKIGSWTFNLENNEMTWSDQLVDIFHEDLSRTMVTFGSLVASIHPDDRDKWLLAVQECTANGTPFTMRFRKQVSGREIWIEARVDSFQSKQKQMTGLAGTFQDVTDVVRTETELQRRQELLEAILDSVPSVIFVRDCENDLRVSLLNRAGEEFFACQEVEMMGRKVGDLNPVLENTEASALDRAALERREMLSCEAEEIPTSQGLRTLRTYRVPTFDENGQPKLLISVFTDITDELKAKQELEAERLKTLHISKLASLGEMSAGIAHEINNPLATIDLVVGQIQKVAHDPDLLKRKIDVVKRSVVRIAKIVRGLRKFARSGEKPDLKEFSLRAIVEEAMTLVEVKARALEVSLRLEATGPALVFCDELELGQVVVNLVTNAIDAVKDKNEKWVRVFIDDGEDAVVMRVIDSGEGIPEQTSKKLFEPFFTTKAVGEGTGLGLSITKGILDEHRASIEVKLNGKNTCFEVRFLKPEVVKAAA